MPNQYKVVTSLFAKTFAKINDKGEGKSANNTILMGSYVMLLDEENGIWQKVKAFGTEGWIEKSQLGDSPDLKIYFVDVGQGDAALLEVGKDEQGKGLKILIDGGPSNNFSRYLNKWQYAYYLKNNLKIHIDYLFISHFDKDHFNGLTEIINNEQYTFGTIYHNGIAKFDNKKSEFPQDYNCKLGKKTKKDKTWYLETSFDSIDELIALKEKGGMIDILENFALAAKNAKDQGRIKNFKRIDYNTTIPAASINNKNFEIKVLGPIPSPVGNKSYLKYFEDESHTINGHSLVLKIQYLNRTFLFGGDLNIPSEDHLIANYENSNPFEVDIAKSCHHGASEFTTAFMAKVNPMATVISSGDNESYSHPRADAIGCAGRYSRGERPLVFSTELARSANVKTDSIKFGMINLRCDGENILMAQMKEAASKDDVWDMYEINY